MDFYCKIFYDFFTEEFNNIETEISSTDDEVLEQESDSESVISTNLANGPGPSNPKKKKSAHNFITPKLVTVLDTCKVSDRDAVRILIATAQALGHDVSNLVVSISTIRRCRTQVRCDSGKELRKMFKEEVIDAVSVHWDGKILPSLTGNDKVDRLPVVISFNGKEQLLGIPAISSGTGKEQAEAVYALLKEWDVVQNVQALCCDTTASNLGRFQGACVLLEQMIEKDLLYFPCQHHILEIILRSVFDQKLRKSSGPNVQIFNKFRDSWSKIDKTNFKCGIEDMQVKDLLGDSNEVILFATETLNEEHARDDYKEFLQLALIFLGVTSQNFSFRMPGAHHHARWMAKAIYCLKIFLFRDEFEMTDCEMNGVRDICIFVVKIYLKVWFKASVAIEAPMQTLTLLKNLHAYSNIDANVSKEALRKFCNHLWYLSPENVALAFFDPNITFDNKKRMVAALDNVNDNDTKKIIALPNNVCHYVNKDIEHFVSQKTLSFFERFNIPMDFLEKDPKDWSDDTSYNVGLNIARKLKVVNDSAERAVKLMEDYNRVLSQNEEEKQFILQIVSEYRKRYPNSKKSTLIN